MQMPALWPELEPPGEVDPLADLPWQQVRASDPTARAMRDRHYSTRDHPGGRTVGPPGRKLVLVSRDRLAAWITHWPDPKLVLDGVDAWRCSMFRNEGSMLSSELVLAAMEATARLWPDRPTAGWLTYVWPSKIASSNPGYCFLRAGWRRDRSWTDRTGRLIRLRADLEVAK